MKTYFLSNLLNTTFKNNDIKKLTAAPTAAKRIVFKISAEFKFGRMLKKVPVAVGIANWFVAFMACKILVVNTCYCKFYHLSCNKKTLQVPNVPKRTKCHF